MSSQLLGILFMKWWVYNAERPSQPSERGRWGGCALRQLKHRQVDRNRERERMEKSRSLASRPLPCFLFYDRESHFISKKKITIQEIIFKKNWPRLVPRHPLNQLERCMRVCIYGLLGDPAVSSNCSDTTTLHRLHPSSTSFTHIFPLVCVRVNLCGSLLFQQLFLPSRHILLLTRGTEGQLHTVRTVWESFN